MPSPPSRGGFPVNLIVAISGVILLGAFLRQRGIVSEEGSRGVSRVCADVLLPCMILNSMIFELTRETVTQCLTLIAASLAALACQYALGWLFVGITRAPREDWSIYRYCILFSNFGLIGIPVAEGLYGSRGVFYFTMCILPYRILFNSYGNLMLRPQAEGGRRFSWRMLCNLPILAVVAGLTCSLLHWRLWGPLGEFVSMLSKANAPMGLLSVGLNLIGEDSAFHWRDLRIWLTVALRTLLLPAGACFLFLLLGLRGELLEIAVLAVALPCPAMVSVLSKRYGGNAVLASTLVLLSTLCFSITLLPVLSLCKLL